MTNNLPDYTAMEPPDGKPIEEYTTHDRRAELLRDIKDAGIPQEVNQREFADRFGVHRSTISRDMDRLRESVSSHLGKSAKLSTQVIYEKTVRELQAAGKWKEAWQVVMEWNDWLAKLGRQHREPTKSALDVEMESRNVDVSYEVVRETDNEIPEDDNGNVDYEALGFTSSPAAVDVEDTGTSLQGDE